MQIRKHPTHPEKQQETAATRQPPPEWNKPSPSEDGILYYKYGPRNQTVLPRKHRKRAHEELHENIGLPGAGRAAERPHRPSMRADISHHAKRACQCLKQPKPAAILITFMASTASMPHSSVTQLQHQRPHASPPPEHSHMHRPCLQSLGQKSNPAMSATMPHPQPHSASMSPNAPHTHNTKQKPSPEAPRPLQPAAGECLAPDK